MKKVNKDLKQALKKRDINFFIRALREIESNEKHSYSDEDMKIIKNENLKWEALINYSDETGEELNTKMNEVLEDENYEEAQIIKTEKDLRENNNNKT